MSKILLIYRKIDDCIETQKILNSAGYFDIVLCSAQNSVSDLPPLEQIGTIVFECEVLGDDELTAVFDLRRRVGEIPVLILAREISISTYRRIAEMKNMVTLQKPYQDSVLGGVLRQIGGVESMRPSHFPRFYTDQPVRMVVLKSGLLIPTRMKNYSAGGAFLEYRGISLRVGDKLQVGFVQNEKTKIGETFQIQAKVIWIKDGDGPRSPARGIGIQFDLGT